MDNVQVGSTATNAAVSKIATEIKTLFKPKFDELAAVAVVMYKQMADDVETAGNIAVSFFRSQQMTAGDLTRLNRAKVYTVDLSNNKYHGKAGSSVEMAAIDLYGSLSETPVAVQKLVQLTNKNNRNGHLKSGPNRIAHILRELYELKADEEWHTEVAGEVIHAIIAWLDAYGTEGAEVPAELTDVAEQFSANATAPFSLGEYFHNMVRLGDEPEQIKKRMAFWADGLQALDAAREEAKDLYAAMPRRPFRVKGVEGHVLEGKYAGYFVVGLAHKDYPIVITKDGEGHVTVSARGFDLDRVYQALALDETGVWYKVPFADVLMNGSRQYTRVLPTKKGVGGIIRILHEHAVRRVRTK